MSYDIDALYDEATGPGGRVGSLDTYEEAALTVWDWHEDQYKAEVEADDAAIAQAMADQKPLASYMATTWTPDDVRVYWYCSMECLAYDMRDTLDGNAPVLEGTVDLGDGWSVDVDTLPTCDPHEDLRRCMCDEHEDIHG